MRTNQIETVIPDGFRCVENKFLIIDSKNQKTYETPYKCPFLTKDFKECWYLKKEIINLSKQCEINDETLIDLEDEII